MSFDSDTPLSEEMLMAFADGELGPDDAARVERALEASPALQEKIEMFLQSRLQTHSAFRAVLAAPVPDRLLRAAAGLDQSVSGAAREGGAVVLPFERSFAPTTSPRRWAGFAIAASLVAGVASGAIFYRVGARQSPASAMAGVMASETRLAERLAVTPDNTVQDFGGELAVTATATYRMANMTFCRTLDVAHTPSSTNAQALFCRAGSGWSLAGVLPVNRQEGRFLPAGVNSGIEALLESGSPGEALAPAEVEALIRSGWR